MDDDAGGGRRGVRATDQSVLPGLLREEYGLVLTHPALDLGGTSNLNLMVRADGGRFVVRVYRPHVTPARLMDIQIARRALAAAATPVPATVPTRDHRDFTTTDARLVEVERFVEHEAKLDSWPRLIIGLHWLGRSHAALANVRVGPDGRQPVFANHVHAHQARDWTTRGTTRIRGWGASPYEHRLADRADRLAGRVDAAEREFRGRLVEQLVHGDYWDDNVLFRAGELALITDLDYLGYRPRIDDLALTLFFAASTLGRNWHDEEYLARFRRLVDAYDGGLDAPLSAAERAALPLALARQPLWGVGRWVALLDDERAARHHAAAAMAEVEFALRILDRLDAWQSGFAASHRSSPWPQRFRGPNR